ncbi:MAG: DoxX family protein [Melioribacteraceae bacterium]|nr:DoxX family protein [Melioribacteraceae bacterium]MCF8356285.1 DoxX family protein [Melioribacteraceae bacterium]MCF8394253.1 DoxX family protein [Melioribacteraceae bacterium]MCF8419974.1 DoxX family protein [Melioribacteraceae bacterium]
MSGLSDVGLLIFRIAIGSIMLFGHGLGKFNRLLSGGEIKFFDPFGIGESFSFVLAVFAEFFASILIVLGLFTRVGSLSLVITMFVAGVIYHFDDPFGGKEKALMYMFSFVLLFFTGPGKYSLQKYIDDKIKNIKGSWRFFLE